MILSHRAMMSDSIKKRGDKVREAVESGGECPFLYCITMPSNEKNLLDIHPYRELRRRKEYGVPFVILGLTKNRREAFSMVTDMVAAVASAMEKPEDFRADFLQYRDSFLP